MEERELKGLFLERIHIELHLFRESMLRKAKKEIYEASYKIEVFVNVYEILMEEVENLDIETVRGVLHWGYGILESLYGEWLGRDDSSFDELKSYVGSELSVLEARGCTPKLENADVAGMICEQILANYPIFEGKSITPHFEDSDKPVIASADSALLNRVIQNLVSNGVKYN